AGALQHAGAAFIRIDASLRHPHRRVRRASVPSSDTLSSENDMTLESTDVLIIGAGPAGSVAAAFLRQQGRRVLVLEREQFPRFSIGESLLPQSMEYIEAAGMLRDVVEAGFQFKNGAAFAWGDKYTAFDFR